MNKKKILISFFLLAITLFFVMSTQTLAATVSKVTGLAVVVQKTSAYLSWDKVTEATGYEVYVDIPNHGYAYLGSVTRNGATIKGFTKGKNYAVKIKAYKTVNGSKVTGDYSSEVRFTAGQKTEELDISAFVDKVRNLKTTINSSSKVTLNWNDVSNADGYEIYINISNRGYLKLGTVKDNRAVVTGFEKGVDYSVRVRAYSDINGRKVYGEYSTESTFRTGNVRTPTIVEEIDVDKVRGVDVEVENSKAYIDWNEVSDADGYELYVIIPGKSAKTITTSNTRYTLSGITNYSQYYSVKVRAYEYSKGKKVYGDYSSVVKFKGEKPITKPARVTGLSGKVTGTKVTLSWNKVSGADGYEINMVIPGYGDTNMTTTNTTRTVSGLTSYYSYTTKVRAYKYVDGKKVYGDYSSSIRVYRK